MKKNLLLVAAVLCSVVASAQTKWSCETTASSDGKKVEGTVEISGTTTESNVTVKDITWGTGILEPTAVQQKWKDATGTSSFYCTDETKALIKWSPANAQIPDPNDATKQTTDAAYRTLDGANANDMYVNFGLEINNQTDFISLSSVEFDAARTGTDALRINAKITANSDAYDSGWLITAGNYATVSDGTGIWNPVSEDGIDEGATPSREDEAKANSSTGKGCTHYTIPVPADFPADAYEMVLKIAVYGVSNNKAAIFHNVTINHGSESAINSVEAAEVASEKYYTVSGMEVAAPVKGINIVKQTMVDGTVKTVKVIR